MHMSQWLSTREASVFLGVSEASVRRWGDRGILPVHRVGRRGERRFSSEHVERLALSERTVRPGVRAEPRSAPQVTLGGTTVEAFSHLALLYDSDARRLRLASPFLRDGLLAGDPCFLIAHGAELSSHLESLRANGLDIDGALRTGQLTVVAAPGRDVDEALGFWEEAFWTALDVRAPVVRVVAEMVSEREVFVSEDEMLAYEAAVNLLTKRFPCVVLCQYDVRRFSGQALLTALRAHPDILALPLRTLLS